MPRWACGKWLSVPHAFPECVRLRVQGIGRPCAFLWDEYEL